MKKNLFLFLVILTTSVSKLHAQKKVFTDIANQISSTTRSITQGGNVLGYMVFTQLEKVNSDSFSYTISLLDENLNDIGKVAFNELGLQLNDLVFENDLLHIAYLQSTAFGKGAKSKKESKELIGTIKNNLLIQTINLEGKIINRISKPVNITVSADYDVYGTTSNKYNATASLRSRVQINETGNTGFTTFYEDKDNAYLSAYNSKCELLWTKTINEKANGYFNINTEKNTYVSFNKTVNGNIVSELYSYSLADGKQGKSFEFINPKNNKGLDLLNLSLDKNNGNLVAAGKIYKRNNSKFKNTILEAKKGVVLGVFNIAFNENNTIAPKETYTYWDDGSQKPNFSSQGKMAETNTYPLITAAIQDYEGNTLFIGDGIRIKTKVGSIIGTVLTLPTLFYPFVIASAGYKKYRNENGIILKQNKKGELSQSGVIDYESKKFSNAKVATVFKITSSLAFSAKNNSAKTNYIGFYDKNNYIIYSTAKNKIIKTIPKFPTSKSYVNISGAKEGHIMLIETNTAARTTTLNIESLEN